MTGIKIEMDQKFFEKVASGLQKEKKSMLDEIGFLIQANIRNSLLSKGIKNTGHLIASYLIERRDEGLKGLAIVGSNSLYALPMELGIQKRFFPSRSMIDSIKRWVKRKLGVSDKDSLRVARAISWKIARKGLDPSRFPSFAVREAYDKSVPRIGTIVERHIRRAMALNARFASE
jgi:hypothetical protein